MALHLRGNEQERLVWGRQEEPRSQGRRKKGQNVDRSPV